MAARCVALILTVWTVGGCAGGPEAEEAPPPYDAPLETLSFEFDGREWVPATRTRANRIAQEIYVLPGENEKEWTELVTRVLTFGAQRGTDLEALLKTRREALEKECPIVTWNTIEVTRRSALYEWSRPQCKELGPQLEIGRIVFGRLGLHTIVYAAKTSRIASGLRRQWVDALRDAELEMRAEGAPASAPSARTSP